MVIINRPIFIIPLNLRNLYSDNNSEYLSKYYTILTRLSHRHLIRKKTNICICFDYPTVPVPTISTVPVSTIPTINSSTMKSMVFFLY